MKISRIALACAMAFGASGVAVAQTSVQLYGHADLSIDYMTKGLSGAHHSVGGGPTPTDPVGHMGYETDVSSNLSYIGVRASHDLGDSGLKALVQFETQVDVASTPSEGGSGVKGAFASRNSFLGIAGNFGAFKVGKTDTPYKLSTGRMDPFSATIGDYNSIMGNTGGDNRAEFDQRLSHSMWYESPNMSGFRANALFSPGMNRASSNTPFFGGGLGGANSNPASGENAVCTGGNLSGGAFDCTDGSFGDAYSVAGVYNAGPFYATLAYEKHKDVNRHGDDNTPLITTGAPSGATVGVGNEQAWKVGLQYSLGEATIIDAIFERMTRGNTPDDFNERQRDGTWLAVTQKFTPKDDINVGWAHAAKTPGSPEGPVDNKSDMFAIGYKHHFDKQANWYAVFARQNNSSQSHFDLGASGHGITTDCHDAAGTCFTGGKIQGASIGAQYNF
ncbi:MAG TPA: porin [Vicinamibacterales bacterium]|nr:porin [Vicinamibacterales bacterium]